MNVRSVKTLDEALAALQGATADTRVLAGGTDLMVEFEIGRTRPDRVIDIWRVAELRRIERDSGGLRLGALVSCGELMRSPEVAVMLGAQTTADFNQFSRSCRRLLSDNQLGAVRLPSGLGDAFFLKGKGKTRLVAARVVA